MPSDGRSFPRTTGELCDPSSHADFSLPGPGFGIYAVVHLLLPVMSLWLRRSHKDHSYWDVASANFKHAIGLSCELVVEHIQSFIHSGIYGATAVHAEDFFSWQASPFKCAYKYQGMIFLNFFNVYSFTETEREREREQARAGQRERGTQNPKQAPGSELSAQSPMRGSNSRTARS